MPRAGTLRKGGKAEAMLGFLQSQGRPCSTHEIAAATGESVRRVWVRMFEMTKAGHVTKVAGTPVCFEAEARTDVGPALAIPLPVVPAALPTDRCLTPHVGVVILLDQNRRAA